MKLAALRNMRSLELAAGGHSNPMWVVPATAAPSTSPSIVLFHGDISAAADEMMTDAFLRRWRKYSTERLATGLATRFPSCNAVVVGPSRRTEAFSCYETFLRCTETGDPMDGAFDSDGQACQHLATLLRSASSEMGLLGDGLLGGPLHLVGFSKGCAPLNQCVAEMGGHGAAPLRARLESLVWLDPGLSSEGPVLITDEAVLRGGLGWVARQRALRSPRASTAAPLRLALAFTPRQYDDADEPWVRTQADEFGAIAERLGLPVQHEWLYFDEPPSLEAHFRCLDGFTCLDGTSATEGGGAMAAAEAKGEEMRTGWWSGLFGWLKTWI